jgi:2'-5' RNA ligase
MPSVQDKYRLLSDPALSNFLVRRYEGLMAETWWWLDPMPNLAIANLPERLEYARRMTGIHGEGDPIWGASIIHMAEQAAGTPFSIEGPESAVKRSMDFMFSAPGGYRDMLKQLCLSWVTSDLGAPLEIIWEAPRKIRDGVYYKPKPIGLDIFDPAHIRPVAPLTMEYPFAYRTTRQGALARTVPAEWESLFRSNEILLHKNAVARIVNLPQTNEELLGIGVSPTAIAVPEWKIAMGFLSLLLQDSTNMSAYNIMVGQGVSEEQVVQAMENRERRLREGHTHALSSALMIFANEDALGDGSDVPKIFGVPLRRYAENWNWRSWWEMRIQIYSTILGISPMSIIMSIYARANQSGAQYASDEAGVRRSSLMVGLSDIFADLVGQLGATFQYRNHRLADRDREYVVLKTAFEAWKIAFESNINGVPLLGETPEIAAERARTMMAEQRLIKDEYANNEKSVEWDHEVDGTLAGDGSSKHGQTKNLAYLAAALKGERWIEVEIDPSGESTKVKQSVIGRCVLREPKRPVQWRGWQQMQRNTTLMNAAAVLKQATQYRSSMMVALYPSLSDAAALALPGEGGVVKAEDLHATLFYTSDKGSIKAPLTTIKHVVSTLAAKTPVQPAVLGGVLLFAKQNDKGERALCAQVDSEGVHEVHEDVVDALEAIGVESDSEHGFTPHITLAYLADGAPEPAVPLDQRQVIFDRIGLAWGGNMTFYPLQPMAEKESRALRGAPRKQKEVQEAWEADLEKSLRKFWRQVKQAGPPPTAQGQPSDDPQISDRDLDALQGYVDRWEMGIDAILDDTDVTIDRKLHEKAEQAKQHIDAIQQEIDSKRNQRVLLALLAIFVLSDETQRLGAARITQGMGLSGMAADAPLLLRELQRLGLYVQGSLTPDLINEFLNAGKLSTRLDRRMMVFYGGALWSAMQIAVMEMAPAGTVMRVDGPIDENNCRESDPGDGVACETIQGKTYVVGVDWMPVLGRDTKCGQACRHWWEVVQM